jgi:tetratricopeptide (TPR) repeat protein
MRKTTAILVALTGIALLAGAAWGQNPLRPKSQKELDALRAIDAAPSVDVKLQKIDDFLTAFADSDYKLALLDTAVGMAADKNDYPLTMAWGQRDLDANPNSYVAMLALASVTAANTREFDLDKDQKLTQADKWVNGALDLLKTAPRPYQFPEEKWPEAKKFYQASCYQTLGLIAMIRKKYDVAATEFQTAFDTLPEPNYLVRLGDANVKAGKYDTAIAAFDKVLAMPDLNPVIKRVTQNKKNDALRRKGVATPAVAAPAAAAPAVAAPAAPAQPAPSAVPAPAPASPPAATPPAADGAKK